MALLGKLFEYDGSGMVDAISGIRERQKQSKLASLLAGAYGAEGGNRQALLQQAIGVDPQAGMYAARMLEQPRNQTPAELQVWGELTKGLSPEQLQKAREARLGILEKPQEPDYDLREINGQYYYIPKRPMTGGQPMMGGQPQAQQQNSPAANAAFEQHIKPLMQREGGYVANDAGAGPTNFGINSRANPDVDVQNLTPDAAQQLYKQRYWDAIGGDQLPPNLQAGAFDAAVNMGPAKAQELLRASGGDPAKFDQLRMQHYENLARSNPQKYAQYLPSWRKRVQETSAMGGMQEQYQDTAGGALPAGAIPVPGLPKGTPKTRDAPSGYQWNADGTSLVPIPGGPADRKNNPTSVDMAKGEMSVRKELQDRVKQDRSILGMFRNVENAAKSGTAAGDLSMIFAYMKMLDPGSVVREQEFANAQNATGVPDRIRNLYNQTMSGNRLNPKQRQEFIAEARQLAAGAQQRVTSETREYQNIAEQYGYDTTRATGAPDFRNAQGASSSTERAGGQAPQGAKYRVGQVIEAGGKRYRIIGGDMNDPDVEEVR